MNTPEATPLTAQNENSLGDLLAEIETAREADPLHALHLCRQAHELARRLGGARLAAERLLEALHLARELGDQATACRCVGNLGNAFCDIGDYAAGLDYYLQGLAAA